MSLAAPSCVQKLRTASPAPCSELWSVCLFREPDVGNPPVRFDEREQETEPCQTGLRRRRESTVNSHREAKATAPVLDSTRGGCAPTWKSSPLRAVFKLTLTEGL